MTNKIGGICSKSMEKFLLGLILTSQLYFQYVKVSKGADFPVLQLLFTKTGFLLMQFQLFAC